MLGQTGPAWFVLQGQHGSVWFTVRFDLQCKRSISGESCNQEVSGSKPVVVVFFFFSPELE